MCLKKKIKSGRRKNISTSKLYHQFAGVYSDHHNSVASYNRHTKTLKNGNSTSLTMASFKARGRIFKYV